MSNVKLWEPSPEKVKQANMTDFMNKVNKRFGKNFTEYNQLYEWSVENIQDFWEFMWEYGDIIHSKKYDTILENPDKMPGAKWFVGSELNFAENLLRYRDDRTALIFKGEDQKPRSMTYSQLFQEVKQLAAAMKGAGIKPGDRVAGFMPNMIETVVAMLAATSMGAIWSSCSPDFGPQGALDRFGQIEPRILFTANGYYYNGKSHDCLQKVKFLTDKIPSIEKVIVVPYTETNPDISSIPSATHYKDFLKNGADAKELSFTQLPFDHPVYIMYSSGTTGVPKCIVHGAGGTLIQHLKELGLHTDLKREDTIFYFTTCGWMMWNWLVSSLALGATLVLFDGSPFYPNPSTLFDMTDELNISIFGTSARYLASAEQAGVKPMENNKLAALKSILSTGSPLTTESFRYVYDHIKKDLCLSSISGGTDIISCFVLGNPILPVYLGEIQCRGLGMKVEAFDQNGKPVTNTKGELVCTRPFPSMPVRFWNDMNDEKYKKAYFATFPNVWHHGDYLEVTDTKGVIIYGRSDATLNPGGVRIGTAEIYQQVESVPEVADSLVVGQKWEGDERVVLCVKMAPDCEFDEELAAKIKKVIRQNTTPRHVPSKIVPVEDIPYTINGKKVEIAVRQVIHGQDVQNKEALANPAALDLYKDVPELKTK